MENVFDRAKCAAMSVVGGIALALMLYALAIPATAYGLEGEDLAASSFQTQAGVSYTYNAGLYDADGKYPGVYTTAVETNEAAAADAPTIGIPSIADATLADAPTLESPAIICGSAVNWYQANGTKAEIEAAGKENARKFTAVSPNRVAPYSYFKYGVGYVVGADGKTPMLDANGNKIPKLTGFDSTYVIVRLDISKLMPKEADDNGKPYYLHVSQDKNNALLVAVGMTTDTGKANVDGRDQWGNMSFANLYTPASTDGKTATAYIRKTASYKLSELYDTTGEDTTTPYLDVILFSSAGIVAGADAQKEGALNGDVELSFYVDQVADYNTALNWDPQSTDTALPNKCLAKFYDEDKAKEANAKVSRYKVKGSDLRLETMVDNSGGQNKDTGTTYWSLSKSMQKPYYDQEIDKSATDTACGRAIKLMLEVPVVDNMELIGASATELKKRTLDVNSFDIQVANNTSQAAGQYTSGLALKNAWLKIMDSNETTGAELAIGNNATMTIDTGAKLIIDKTCQLEIEWDGATTTPAADGQPAPAQTDILNNGSLDLRSGGTLENDGVVTIEGTEGKPYQATAAETATKSEKGQGELKIGDGATFINNGCFMPNGSLYVLGTLVNNGKYSETISSNDPDKGLFTYHKGIQSTWKDDVTQENVMYGGIYVNMTKQIDKDNSIWVPQFDGKGVIENNGDIVLCPGELVNFGTVKNAAGSHIYSCATDKAIVPIEPDPNNPTVTTKTVTFDTPKGSYINNFKTIENAGEIVPAYVEVDERTRGLGTLTVDGLDDKFKDCFDMYTYSGGKITNTGTVYKHDLSRSKIDLMFGPLVADSAPYDGLSWSPDIRVTPPSGLGEYYPADDFSITYQDPSGKTITDEEMIDAGAYKLVLGEGNVFKGSVTKTFTIEPAVLSAVEIDADSFVGDGNVHKPTVKSVTAKSGDRELSVPASGYTISYSADDPKDAGTYTITVTGKGNYTGSIAKTFTITEPTPAPTPTPTPVTLKEITSAKLAAYSYVYDGNVHKPAVTSVKAGDEDVPEAGYTVTYSTEDPTAPGEYVVTIKGNNAANYTGTITKTFVIERRSPTVVTRPKTITDVELDADMFTYDGAAHKPAVTSVKAGVATVPADGYTVSYSPEGLTDAGEYKVIVVGTGSSSSNGSIYTGSVTKTFKIEPATLSDAALDSNAFTYDGAAHKPAVTSVKAGSLDVPATSYTATYSAENPADVGEYTVAIAGTGNFTGSITKTFKIEPATLTDATLDAATFTYDGAAHKPAAKSVSAGSLAVPAAGYTVSYSDANPTNAGTYTATIAGAGNFTGSVAKTFTIGKAANTLTLKGKTLTAKKAKLAKKAKTYKRAKLMNVSKAQGTTTYKLASVKKAKFKKFFKVNKKTGNVTVKKGLKAGTYKVNVKVTAAGTGNYNAVTKTVKCTVKVV